MIYIMNPEFAYHIPSEEYVNACIKGYEDFEFDKKILDETLKYSRENKGKKLKKY